MMHQDKLIILTFLEPAVAEVVGGLVSVFFSPLVTEGGGATRTGLTPGGFVDIDEAADTLEIVPEKLSLSSERLVITIRNDRMQKLLIKQFNHR